MNKTADIVEKVAMSVLSTRGMQGPRKDRDLMSDTGGTSKGRELKTPLKPPRDDLKKRYRTKDTPSEHHEKDTDRNPDKGADKDLKACIHSFLDLPAPTYSDSVWGALVNIISEERGVSEKAFRDRDAIGQEARQTIAERKDLVDECEREDARPELCAEILYGVLVLNEPHEQFFDIRASFRETVMLAKRELARFPNTFMSLMGRG